MDHRQQALAWLAEDPDPATREEVQRLLDLGDEPGLADRFGQRLEFGTAGIRGALGAGPNRMNRAMVRRITAGLADRLNAAAGAAGARGVVVGRDARHGSDAFEADAVRVLAGAGLGVWTFEDVVPTPLVAWAVRYLEAAAAVMITASHNPPGDNGYKVYGPGGRQLLPQLDEEVSAAIDAIVSLDDVPLAPPDSDLIWRTPREAIDHYVAHVLTTVDDDAPRELRIAYTPLHGVAGDLCTRVLREAGFTDVHVVDAQAEPDPEFPTVEFPNPEEPGAMDAVMALAEEVGADLILANDPDGDRVAAAIPGADGWRLLSGDEVGTLLAEDLLVRGRPGDGTRPAVGTTVVSSTLLSRIAAAHGAVYVETLTGFKWLAEEAEAMEGEATMVLAYEQALGVTVGDVVRDKDGIGGALAIADLAARLHADGRTLADALDDLVRAHGAHVTLGRSVELDGDDDVVQRLLDALRQRPPAELGGTPVVEVWDHDAGVMTRTDGSVETIELPPTPLLRYVAEDGTRAMVRPSGTEPKLKFYAEAIAHDADPGRARTGAAERVTAVLDAFMAHALGKDAVSP